VGDGDVEGFDDLFVEGVVETCVGIATRRRRVFDAEEGGGVVTGFSSTVDPPRAVDVAAVAGTDRVTALIALDVAAVAAENAEATIMIVVVDAISNQACKIVEASLTGSTESLNLENAITLRNATSREQLTISTPSLREKSQQDL
jgi:hypothetical protein